jgi:hypothetical protein
VDSSHECKPPLLLTIDDDGVAHKASPGCELWRCECGQLWQNSWAKNGWITVTPEYDAVFDRLGLLPENAVPTDRREP